MEPKISLAIRRATRYLLKKHKDTLALILIGSVADGTNTKDSDIDIVCVKNRKLNYDALFKIERELNHEDSHPRIQLVPFTMSKLKWHFDHSSTMAHSIKNGTMIFKDKDGRVSTVLNKRLSMPTKEWMNYWLRHWLNRYEHGLEFLKMGRRDHRRFCKKKCECYLPDDLARVVVNFAILYLELRGFVPVSKFQIRREIIKHVGKSDMKNIELALTLAGRDKRMTLEQNLAIMSIAKKLRRRLVESEIMKVAPATL